MAVKRTGAPADAAQRIDAVYGLEPVYEPSATGPGSGAQAGSEFHRIQCPYCGEEFETLIDLSAGSATYVEDCQVCCQPIEFRIEVDSAGALGTLTVGRDD